MFSDASVSRFDYSGGSWRVHHPAFGIMIGLLICASANNLARSRVVESPFGGSGLYVDIVLPSDGYRGHWPRLQSQWDTTESEFHTWWDNASPYDRDCYLIFLNHAVIPERYPIIVGLCSDDIHRSMRANKSDANRQAFCTMYSGGPHIPRALKFYRKTIDPG